MTTQPSRRTVRANGNKILELRTGKGWNLADLAAHAVCSEKTAKSVENGRPVYQSTLRKIAEALGSTPADLIGNAALPPPPHRKRQTIQVTIRLDVDFDQLDESDHVVALIASLTDLISAKEAIELNRVEAGSTVIVLDMCAEDILALLRAIREASGDAPRNSLIINGITLTYIKSEDELEKQQELERRKKKKRRRKHPE